jgi:hypothetical protein
VVVHGYGCENIIHIHFSGLRSPAPRTYLQYRRTSLMRNVEVLNVLGIYVILRNMCLTNDIILGWFRGRSSRPRRHTHRNNHPIETLTSYWRQSREALMSYWRQDLVHPGVGHA